MPHYLAEDCSLGQRTQEWEFLQYTSCIRDETYEKSSAVLNLAGAQTFDHRNLPTRSFVCDVGVKWVTSFTHAEVSPFTSTVLYVGPKPRIRKTS